MCASVLGTHAPCARSDDISGGGAGEHRAAAAAGAIAEGEVSVGRGGRDGEPGAWGEACVHKEGLVEVGEREVGRSCGVKRVLLRWVNVRSAPWCRCVLVEVGRAKGGGELVGSGFYLACSIPRPRGGRGVGSGQDRGQQEFGTMHTLVDRGSRE